MRDKEFMGGMNGLADCMPKPKVAMKGLTVKQIMAATGGSFRGRPLETPLRARLSEYVLLVIFLLLIA